jgi:hypothetical protein
MPDNTCKTVQNSSETNMKSKCSKQIPSTDTSGTFSNRLKKWSKKSTNYSLESSKFAENGSP